MEIFWIPLIVLSGVASAVVLGGGLATRRRSHPFHSALAAKPPQTPKLALATGELDLGAELRLSVQAHDERAVSLHIRLETAIEPGLTVCADPNAVRSIVAALLDNAVDHSAGGRVLLGAGRHGGRVRIAVVDDGDTVAREVQEANLRDAERLVALQGGSLEVNVRRGAGSVVSVRLPEPPLIRALGSAPVFEPAPVAERRQQSAQAG